MLKLPEKREPKAGESTIALINVVFLMLIFFLISGTLVPPIDKELSPIEAEEAETAELENMLSIRKDGETYAGDVQISPEEYYEAYSQIPENAERPIRIFPDQGLPAPILIDVINRMKAAGAKSLLLVTERKDGEAS